MREVTRVAIPDLLGVVQDVDVTEDGDYVLLVGDALHTRRLYFSSGDVVTPWIAPDYPIVRLCNEGALVVSARRVHGRSTTSWKVGRNATVMPWFPLGDAVQDILTLEYGRIVVTYFDEGVFGGDPGAEGLVVFGQDGSISFRYHEFFGYDVAQIYDCYCATLLDDGRVAICPYGKNPSFPLVLIDLTNGSREIKPTPEDLHGSSALSLDEEHVYFWGPYRDKTGIYKWLIGAAGYERIGDHEGPLRGLPGGRFLHKRSDGFSILEP